MRPEAAPYLHELGVLVAFLEGRLEGMAFEQALQEAPMQALLKVFINPLYPALTNYYRQVTNDVDLSTQSGLAQAELKVEEFLKLAEVEFQPVKPHFTALSKFHSFLHSVQPAYLDLPMEFILEHVLPKDVTLSEAQKKKLGKERIKELFKYSGKPPQWIQSPEWPIHGDVPSYFIGQLPIKVPELFHDNGAAYLFFDAVSGGFETVTQFY